MNSPDGWRKYALGEVAQVTVGGTPSTDVPSFWGGDVPWMASGDVHLRRIADVPGRISALGLRSSNATLVDPPTVAIGLAGQGKTRGTAAFVECQLSTNQSVALISGDRQHFLTAYLFYDLDHRYEELRGRSSGGGRGGLSKGIIEKVPLLLPPIPEQALISKILDTMDGAVRSTEHLIAKLENVRRGLVHDLLTRGIDENLRLRDPMARPEQFVEVESRLLPKGWRVCSLDEFLLNYDGRRIPLKQEDRDRRTGEYRYFGASGVIDHVDSYIFDGDFILLGEDGENVVSRQLPLAFRVTGQFWVNNHAHVFTPLQGNDIRFLTHLLEFTDYSSIVLGSAQPKITQAGLRRLRFVLPQLDEQVEIADRLEASEARLVAEREQVAKLRQLRDGLMHDLLTGRVRVNLDEEAA